MTKSDEANLQLHEDPVLFREAVNYTVARAAFAARLVEKDYFSTLLLAYLTEADDALVFKGGTCLAKIHAEFYRMSEDLDFAVSMRLDTSRRERSSRASVVKAALAVLDRRLPPFVVLSPLKGASSSTQYVAVVGYRSLLGSREETIKIEISLREPLLTEIHKGDARTMLLDPISGGLLVKALRVPSMSKTEILAEKFRAALTRREPAIRDYFDIDYAMRKLDLQPRDDDFIRLVHRKLEVPGNDPLNVSERRLADLRRQVESQLKPVLRGRDFADFDLDRACREVAFMAQAAGAQR